ncbi:MAG TPA: COX15/CtaA family protein [Pelagibacterium sp.]|uniref:COX15/CtaA family protein n=1 Tax=Pelagibacterium sp. TaxID=1967288 RepID=UPI002C766765|nr:COX15/CtaA family protein [Pelagibacterium sp.]HWJ87513.1 COX15/CtaA family protein [Pelagibacterium sp.]
MSAIASAGSASLDHDRIKPVRIWLYCLAAFVFVMVLVGGATRLTESGLSITSWRPISGIIPPLSAADWQAEFEAYQQIPQYEEHFAGWMGVAEFKLIFWWEWIHRFLGRMLGFAFAIPFLIFLAQRRIPGSLTVPLVGLFLLGGFQGFLGWWMVSSGLSELTYVSQYRLAAHLCAACALMVALIWVARGLEPEAEGTKTGKGWTLAVWGLFLLLFVQIGAGGLVAGLHAGLIYNTWPLMDGALIPNGLFPLDSVWKSAFEDVMTVQFNHRTIAYVIAVYAGLMWLAGRFKTGFGGIHIWMPAIAMTVLLQIFLGIGTLLSVVGLPIALGHQAVAFLLIGIVTAYAADIHRLSSR